MNCKVVSQHLCKMANPQDLEVLYLNKLLLYFKTRGKEILKREHLLKFSSNKCHTKGVSF